MTVALTKVETQVVWRSPTVGTKTTTIPGADSTNKGYDLDISTPLGNGDAHIVTPLSGTIDGAANFQFTDTNCTLALRSDADNSDWIIRYFCCLAVFDAVYFDGFSGSYIGPGPADSPRLSFSFWIRGFQPVANQTIISLDATGNVGGYFFWTNHGDQIIIRLFSTSFDEVFARVDIPRDNTFHNILGSIDVSTSPGVGIFYVDETLQDNFSVDDGPWDIHFSDGIALPDYPAPPGRFQLVGTRGKHNIGDFWWAPGQFIDFSVAANRLKFHAASLMPVAASSLGAHGEIPTGTAPAMFLTGGKSTFGNNLGTMGALTFTPVIEDSLDGLHAALPAPATTKGGVRFFGVSLQMTLIDGVNFQLLNLIADSAIGTLSVWLRLSALPSAGQYYQLGFGAGGGSPHQVIYDIALDSSGNIRAQFYAIGGITNAIFTQTTNSFPADNTWHHLIMSWDTSAGTMQIVRDRTSAVVTHSGSSGFSVPWSINAMTNRTAQYFFSSVPSPPFAIGHSMTGDAGELFVDWYHKLDLTISSNLDKFNNSGAPADLGVDGSTPFGAVPYCYFSQQPQTYESLIFYQNRAHPNNSHGFGVVAEGMGTTIVNTPVVAPAPYP